MPQIHSLSIEQSPSDYSLWDRLCILKDRLIADTRFQNRVAKIPFLKNIAKKRKEKKSKEAIGMKGRHATRHQHKSTQQFPCVFILVMTPLCTPPIAKYSTCPMPP